MPRQRLKLAFDKGVYQAYDDSDLPNGFASRMENWEPLPSGGFRARPGWQMGPSSGAPSPFVAAGLDYQGAWNKYIAVHWNGTDLKAYAADVDATNVWSAFALVGTLTGSTTIVSGYYFTTSAGGLNKLYIGGRMLAKLYAIDGSGTLTDSGALAVPTYVRALEYHLDSLWAAGGRDTSGTLRPYRLMWTNPGGDPLVAWPTANYIDVRADDVEPITSLHAYHDYLLIGKTGSLWMLSGSPPNVNLHRLDDCDVTQGNAIASTPDGAVICGRRNVYLYDGAAVRRISNAVTEQYTGVRGADAIPFGSKVYILGRPVVGAGTEGSVRVVVYDFVSKAWHIETWPEKMARMALVKGDTFFPLERMITGPGSGSAGAMFHRYEWEAQRERTVDSVSIASWAEIFDLVSPEYHPQGEQGTFRHLELRLRQKAGNAAEDPAILTGHVRLADGSVKDFSRAIQPRYVGNEWVERVDLPGTAYAVQFELEHVCPAGQETFFDLIEAVLWFDEDSGPR